MATTTVGTGNRKRERSGRTSDPSEMRKLYPKVVDFYKARGSVKATILHFAGTVPRRIVEMMVEAHESGEPFEFEGRKRKLTLRELNSWFPKVVEFYKDPAKGNGSKGRTLKYFQRVLSRKAVYRMLESHEQGKKYERTKVKPIKGSGSKGQGREDWRRVQHEEKMRRIREHLQRDPEVRSGELAEVLSMPVSTVTHYMAKVREEMANSAKNCDGEEEGECSGRQDEEGPEGSLDLEEEDLDDLDEFKYILGEDVVELELDDGDGDGDDSEVECMQVLHRSGDDDDIGAEIRDGSEDKDPVPRISSGESEEEEAVRSVPRTRSRGREHSIKVEAKGSRSGAADPSDSEPRVSGIVKVEVDDDLEPDPGDPEWSPPVRSEPEPETGESEDEEAELDCKPLQQSRSRSKNSGRRRRRSGRRKVVDDSEDKSKSESEPFASDSDESYSPGACSTKKSRKAVRSRKRKAKRGPDPLFRERPRLTKAPPLPTLPPCPTLSSQPPAEDDHLDFRCPTCPSLRAMDIHSFVAHLVFHGKYPKKCTECQWHLMDNQDLIDKHWTEVHASVPEPPSKCVEVTPGAVKVFRCGKKEEGRCSELFETLDEREAHEKAVHGVSYEGPEEELKTCPICPSKLRTVGELRLHKAVEHPLQASLDCSFCDHPFLARSHEGIPFRHLDLMRDHILDRHPELNRSRAYKYKNKGKDGGKGVYFLQECPLCGLIVHANSFLKLSEHLNQEHDLLFKKNYTCPICLEGVLYANSWSHVKQRHWPDHHFICQYCGRDCKTKKSWKVHELAHEVKEKRADPFVCDLCGKEYPMRSSLTLHRQIKHGAPKVLKSKKN